MLRKQTQNFRVIKMKRSVKTVYAAGLAVVGGSVGFGIGYTFSKKEQSLRHFDLAKFGLPERETSLISYNNYLVCYDNAKKIPVWVAERLTEKQLKGDAKRTNIKFNPDPRIETIFSAANDDYWNSGWSRGHMAAAGNYKRTLDDVRETFYLTNVVPQDIQNNGGYWNLFEIYCRDLVDKYKNVYVYSGPLFMPITGDDGRKEFVTYQVIGKNKVAVPTHLYKIVLIDRVGHSPAVGAFAIPNKSIPFDEPLQKYEVALDVLEKHVGVKFFPKAKTLSHVDNLCDVDGCKFMNIRDFTIYYISRRMKNNTSLKYLEKDWKEAQEKGVSDHAELKSLYESKRQEIAAATADKGRKAAEENISSKPS